MKPEATRADRMPLAWPTSKFIARYEVPTRAHGMTRSSDQHALWVRQATDGKIFRFGQLIRAYCQ